MTAGQLKQQLGHRLRCGRRCRHQQAHFVRTLVQLELQEGATGAFLLDELAHARGCLRCVAQVERSARGAQRAEAPRG